MNIFILIKRAKRRYVYASLYGSSNSFSFGCKYRSGTVNSKSFVSMVLLRIKWKFELTVHFKHGILGQL